jgi:hypothetical protein
MRRADLQLVLAALVIGGCGGERPAKTDAKQTATPTAKPSQPSGY